MNIRIVTDSGAQFVEERFAQKHQITIVPYTIKLGSSTWREGVDLSSEQGLQHIRHSPTPPVLIPPSFEDYLRVYEALAPSADVILSIHTSRELTQSWEAARLAAQRINSRCEIIVFDSQLVGVGQGLLIKAALRAAQTATSGEALARAARSFSERLYAIYYVESARFLRQHRMMSDSHIILSDLLKIKPFFTLDNGQFSMIGKAQTELQIADRLYEFVAEFDQLHELVIVQPTTEISNVVRMVTERLSNDFPKCRFVYIVYNLSLACLVGPDATGIIVMES